MNIVNRGIMTNEYDCCRFSSDTLFDVSVTVFYVNFFFIISLIKQNNIVKMFDYVTY